MSGQKPSPWRTFRIMESEHLERASHYIGSAGLAAGDDPGVTVQLAQVEAILVLADAVRDLAKSVRQAGGVPEEVDPALQPLPPGWDNSNF